MTKTYEGKPCTRCGGTTRRKHNADCVACRRLGWGKGLYADPRHRAERQAHNESRLRWRRENPSQARAHANIAGARQRARKRGFEFDLDAEFRQRLEASFGAPCPACGQTMVGDTWTRPTIDRVCNDTGYTLANCAIICLRCNGAKSTLTSAELQRLADWTRVAEAQCDFFNDQDGPET